MQTAISLVVLIISVIAHEVAHGYAAYTLGDPTAKLSRRLTLNPLAHIDPMGSIIIPALLLFSGTPILFGWAKPVPYNPYNLRNQRWGEALVAAAGPATNIALAVLFGLLVRAAGQGFIPQSAGDFAALVCFVNLFLGFFNLIPFPPLDGYTVLRGLLPFRASYPLREFENRVRVWGTGSIVVVLVVFAYLFSAPFSYFVSVIFAALVGLR